MSKLNGTDTHAGEIRVNPQEAARMALMFLARADFKRHERQAFDTAEALLGAIAEGTVTLTPREAPRAPAGGIQEDAEGMGGDAVLDRLK